MKSIFTSGGKLFLICSVAALTLGIINAITAPVIAGRKVLELNMALTSLTGELQAAEGVTVEEESVVKAYYPVIRAGKVESYILQLSGSGYGGDMKILSRYKLDGKIISVKMMDNLETPGLGKKSENPEYMKKFISTGSSDPVPVRKDMLEQSEAEAITGATITFIGVAKALEEGSRFITGGRILKGGE
ncbi:MAG: FMN-binding protein [Spirochaeta sp.]|nr:FMN-binding protein [Spirochaeta sp.]